MELYKNKKTGKIFLSLDGEYLIAPNGKNILFDDDLFLEVETGELSEEQTKIIAEDTDQHAKAVEYELNKHHLEYTKQKAAREKELAIAKAFLKDFGSDKYLISLADAMVKQQKNNKN